MQVILTCGIFFTPVFSEPAMLGARATQLAMFNPLAPLLDGLRLELLTGHNLLQPFSLVNASVTVVAWSPWWLVYSAVWAVAGLWLANAKFHRLQYLFAEYI